MTTQQDVFKQIASFYIHVPENYVHHTCLAQFAAAHRPEFDLYRDHITDTNFCEVDPLIPGRLYRALIFKADEDAAIHPHDCFNKLRVENADLVGAQGLRFAYEQAKDQLPKGVLCVSLDKRSQVVLANDYVRALPMILRSAFDTFSFEVVYYGSDWSYRNICILAFRLMPKGTYVNF